MVMKIEKVGVIGCGQMGSGIVEVVAKAGYDVVVREVNQELMDRGMARIRKSLDRAVAKGRLAEAERDAALARITPTTSLEELKDRDLVIEAVVEQKELKMDLFRELDGICPPETIFCTNTSSLVVTELAMATSRQDRFACLHFFNPVPVMKLVEVVRTILTSDETFETIFEFARSVGKTPVAAVDNSGFIVNRLLIPYLLDAISVYEQGLASKEDIDTGMKLGCGHPMGPLTLCDFIGLDTMYHVAEIMFEEYREPRFAPPGLLKRMVLAGRLGRKTGKGFYDYD
jgi:3-hydroxyacyl-CoA dehydrogenase